MQVTVSCELRDSLSLALRARSHDYTGEILIRRALLVRLFVGRRPVVATSLVAGRLLDLVTLQELTFRFVSVVLPGIVLVRKDSGPILGRNDLLFLFGKNGPVVRND